MEAGHSKNKVVIEEEKVKQESINSTTSWVQSLTAWSNFSVGFCLGSGEEGTIIVLFLPSLPSRRQCLHHKFTCS